jgi:hypothetical protein
MKNICYLGGESEAVVYNINLNGFNKFISILYLKHQFQWSSRVIFLQYKFKRF